MNSREWMIPLNLAIAFHLILALGTVFIPQLFKPAPRFEDIYTVSLINSADLPEEILQESTPPPQASTDAPVPENAVSIAQPVVEATQPVQPEAISLKPRKTKVKRDVPEPKPRQDLSKIQRQKLAEMIRAEQDAAEQARILAEEAEIERRLAESAQKQLDQARRQASTQTATSSNSEARPGAQLSALENQYYAKVIARLQAYWRLPETKIWEPSLQATLIVTVNSDGSISNSYFEQRSGDRIFDLFVTKTLQDAGQLPPMPAAMKKNRMELGLRFTPGGIQ